MFKTHPDWKPHLPWLLLGLAVPALAALMQGHQSDRLAFGLLPDFPLPALCASRRLLGVNCPGCGLTRSIVFLVHGDWHASLAMHRLGWLIFALIIAQVPYRLWRMRGGELRVFCEGALQSACWITLGALLVANWLWTLLAEYAS